MSQLRWRVFLSLLAVVASQQVPPCAETYPVNLGKNSNWNLPKKFAENEVICYTFTYSDDTYATLHVDFQLFGDQDGLWIQGKYQNNRDVYGFEPLDPSSQHYSNLGPMDFEFPPGGLSLGVYRHPNSNMEIKKVQIVTTKFNPKKKPGKGDSCATYTTNLCVFDSFKKDQTYQITSQNGKEIRIHEANYMADNLLIYDANFNYIGPGYYTYLRHNFEDTTINIYSMNAINSEIVFAQDDYQFPTQPPPPTHQTFPTHPPVTFPPVITNPPAPTTKSSNNGQSTTSRHLPTTPKTGSKHFGYVSLITGLLSILAENFK